jgi:hypothetical protein
MSSNLHLRFHNFARLGYFTTSIMFLDIIHRPVYFLRIILFIFENTNVSETGFCPRPQVKPTQLGPRDRYFRKFRSEIILCIPHRMLLAQPLSFILIFLKWKNNEVPLIFNCTREMELPIRIHIPSCHFTALKTPRQLPVNVVT